MHIIYASYWKNFKCTRNQGEPIIFKFYTRKVIQTQKKNVFPIKFESNDLFLAIQRLIVRRHIQENRTSPRHNLLKSACTQGAHTVHSGNACMNECPLCRLRESRQKETRTREEARREKGRREEEEEHEEEEEEEEKEEEHAPWRRRRESGERIVLFQTTAESGDVYATRRALFGPYVAICGPFFPRPVRFDVVLL